MSENKTSGRESLTASREGDRDPKSADQMYGTVNDRRPNFRDAGGYLYLVRCFACSPARGKENYCLAVPHGECAWCGWKDDHIEERPTNV